MWSMDLESRILELAEERGLLEAGASEALGNRDWLSPEALEAASAWGPRLDHLLSRGSLAEEQLQSLAWEAIQAPTPDASLPAPIPEEDPALASRFQGLALLGEGATARVYRAFDTRLQRPVALKRLKSVHGHHRQRLLAEAKAQARVDHPFVCKVYDVWESGGEALIVLQLAEEVPWPPRPPSVPGRPWPSCATRPWGPTPPTSKAWSTWTSNLATCSCGGTTGGS